MNDVDRDKFREFLTTAPIRGAVELRSKLAITEEEYQLLAPTLFSNGRDYFLYALCDDLIGVGSALTRWKDLCGSPTFVGKPDAIDRATFRGIVVEQRAWTRKLMEALVDLVCFQQTNGNEYYQHALLIAEYARAVHRQEDRLEFFERRLHNLDEQIALLETDLRRIEEKVDLGRAWYRRGSKPLATKIDGKRLQSSFRSRLKIALNNCRPLERMLLGQTYSLYSQKSGSIHFSARASHRDDWSEIPRLFTHAGFLASVVLVRAARLGGVELREEDWMLSELERTFGADHLDSTARAVLSVPLSVGDFAQAYGMLVRVAEIHVSQYGYEAYRVRILDGDGSSQKEDWMTRIEVDPFVAAQSIIDRTRAVLHAHGASPHEGALDAAVESSIVELWRGLKTGKIPG